MMDALERMALDLEEAQVRRAKRFKNKQKFYSNDVEQTIFDTIKTLRENSRSFDPKNYKDK